jgi:DNA-binding transcriptional MerR regulator
VYGIGTVARLAQVSVRTLRHYDDIGLLKPARVDPQTGYRSYAPEQLHRLHRILVLRDLGVPLAEITDLLEDEVSVEQMRGILRLRQAEARARLTVQTDQLARVEARLSQLEEGSMTGYEVIVKRLDPVRVVALSEDLVDHNQIGEATGRLYPRLHAALGRHGVAVDGVSYAFYEDTDNVKRPLRVTTALPVPADVAIEEDGVTTIDVAGVERAATTVVRGPPTMFHDGFAAIHDWVEQTGERATAFDREVYLDCDGPRETWVTELQTILGPKS